MQRRSAEKLKLSKETLRRLNEKSMAVVVGGTLGSAFVSCVAECYVTEATSCNAPCG
jgi:hypothetical protein